MKCSCPPKGHLQVCYEAQIGEKVEQLIKLKAAILQLADELSDMKKKTGDLQHLEKDIRHIEAVLDGVPVIRLSPLAARVKELKDRADKKP
jgi:peroxiredoxin